MSLLTRSTTKETPAAGAEGTSEGAPDTKAARAARAGGRRRATTASTSVNLLSPWVLDELHVRKLRRRFVMGGVALLVVVVAAWGMLRLDHSRNQQDLADDEAVGQGLRTQIADLGDVKVYVGNVQQRSISVETSLAHQIAFSTVMESLERALPAGTTLASVTVVLPPDPATTPPGTPVDTTDALCPGPDPFGSRPVIGCVEISGTADSRADVSTLVQALGRSDLFIEPFIRSTTSEDGDAAGVIQFQGSLGLDETTYTGRFADVDGSEKEVAGADRAAPADATPATTGTKKAQR